MDNIFMFFKQAIKKIQIKFRTENIIQKILEKIKHTNIKDCFIILLKIGVCVGVIYGIMNWFMYLITPEAGLIDIVGENVQEVDGNILVANANGEANEIRIAPFYDMMVLVNGYEIIDSDGNIKNSIYNQENFIIKIKSDHEMRIENLGNKKMQYDFYIDDISGMEFYYRDELILDDYISLDSKGGVTVYSWIGIIGKRIRN